MLCLPRPLSPGTYLSAAVEATTRPAPPRSATFWSAAAQAQNPDANRSLAKRLKFFVRAWTQRRFTRAWLACLVHPEIAPLWALRPRLATKLQRPYVSCAWDTPVRCAALLSHYHLLPQLFATPVREAIYRQGVNVLRLTHAPTGRRLDVRLFYHDKFEKEGELTLAIRDPAAGLVLSGLTFTLAHRAGQWCAIIGGLQSSHDPATRPLIHDAAKALHGLRPKALALWCLQQLCEPWGIKQIQAVGDAQHVWQHWRKRLEIPASYDEFWRESDSQPLPGGGRWALPLSPQPRPREELKPSRRKQHERRYALLAALRPKLLSAFAALAPEGIGAAEEIPEFIHGTPETPGDHAALSAAVVLPELEPAGLAGRRPQLAHHSF